MAYPFSHNELSDYKIALQVNKELIQFDSDIKSSTIFFHKPANNSSNTLNVSTLGLQQVYPIIAKPTMSTSHNSYSSLSTNLSSSKNLPAEIDIKQHLSMFEENSHFFNNITSKVCSDPTIEIEQPIKPSSTFKITRRDASDDLGEIYVFH